MIASLRRMARREETGAFLILWALLILVLLMMVAIVIDLGSLRQDRRANQTVADLGALAAGQKLASGGVSAQAACADAWTYVQTNTPGLPTSASMPCSNFAVFANPLTPCGSTSAPVTATATGADPYAVVFTYPVPDTEIIRTSGTPPTTAPLLPSDGTQCERMEVSVTRERDTSFAGVLGVDSQSITSSAIVRGNINFASTQTAALVLLERTGCDVLNTSGGLASVLVQPADLTHPGIIHADSDGSTNCGTGTPAQRHVVYGGSLNPAADRPSQPSILAEAAPGGSPAGSCGVPAGGIPGELDLVAEGTNPGVAAADVPNGVCPAPTVGVTASRKVVDDKYNVVYGGSGPKAINGLRATAQAAVTLTTATATAAGYGIFPSLPGESCNMKTPVVRADPKLFVNCLVLEPTSMTFTGGEFVVSGRVDVGGLLHLPNATKIFIGGCGACGGGGPGSIGLRVQGTFVLGTTLSGTPPLPVTCPSGVTAGSRTLVVYSGPYVSAGGGGSDATVSMCQTFLYMANQTSPYQTVSGGSCTASLPCPRNGGTSGDGYVTIFGNIDWTAPNEWLNPPDTTHRYEDLAFWSEAGTDAASSHDSEIKGAGAVKMTGVYFLPNGKFKFSGQASLAQPLDAQFIARRLTFSGQGTLTMKPDPRNSVQTPEPAWKLIR